MSDGSVVIYVEQLSQRFRIQQQSFGCIGIEQCEPWGQLIYMGSS